MKAFQIDQGIAKTLDVRSRVLSHGRCLLNDCEAGSNGFEDSPDVILRIGGGEKRGTTSQDVFTLLMPGREDLLRDLDQTGRVVQYGPVKGVFRAADALLAFLDRQEDGGTS